MQGAGSRVRTDSCAPCECVARKLTQGCDIIYAPAAARAIHAIPCASLRIASRACYPGAGGASGAFLFPSRDGQLVVKTLNAEEAVALQRLAPAFAAHHARHPDSLINHFLGQFRMFLYGRCGRPGAVASSQSGAGGHAARTLCHPCRTS